MKAQPIYHWKFDERQGTVARDNISGVEGRFSSNSNWAKHGRIGGAIVLDGGTAHVNFGNVVGQFGTSDFTVAFGMKILNNGNDNDLDIIGTRTAAGHRNVFSVQLRDKTQIVFHVCEDESGKNFIEVATPSLPLFTDKKWHHVAVVRQDTTLKIYVDGELVAQNSLVSEISFIPPILIDASTDLSTFTPPPVTTTTIPLDTGPASIDNGQDLRLGHWSKRTAVAHYEDLRIYHTALNDLQIENLVPSFTRPLRAGQVELIGPDNAAVILSEDMANITTVVDTPIHIRFGPNTGINLYNRINFAGDTRKFYTDVSDVNPGGDPPRSIRVWSSVGEPFTGKWVIKAPNGQFLSWSGTALTTSPTISSKEFFTLSHNPNHNLPQFVPVTDTQGRLFPLALFVNHSGESLGAFSVVNLQGNQWLVLNADKSFGWTSVWDERSVFAPVVKIADNEGQVGEIVEGEVVFYEHASYVGRSWVLSDSDPLASGSYPDFRVIPGLNDALSSVRLGPNTGVTLFAHPNNQVNEAKRETEIEDLTENLANMQVSQIGHDKVSGVAVFRRVSSKTIFNSFTSKLSEDYRLVGNELQSFSAYRTILRFLPGIAEVEVSATDLTTIVVEGKSFEIDEVRSVTLRPNELNQIMITSEADGLTTPALKFRTSSMGLNERVIIFPDRDAHQQIADLEDDALWNANDAKGNLIVDQTAHSQSDIATLQNTIKRVMSTVAYTDTVVDVGGSDSIAITDGLKSSQLRGVPSTSQKLSGAGISNAWTLHLSPPTNSGTGAAVVADGDIIREQALTQSQFEQMWAEANAGAASVLGGIGAASRRGLFSDIKDAFKDASSVVINFANDALQTIINVGNQAFAFVLDTAAKVATFVEAIVEKVVTSIKQFIEFLRFLFDWEDILNTQKFLVDSINHAFDYATDLVDSAKAPVAKFIDGLQEGIEDGVNNLIRELGGDPDADDEGPGLPEAAEWFLNLILGESRGSDNETTIQESAASDGTVGDSLEDAFNHLLEALRDVVGIGAEIADGMIDTIEAFIKNPLRPELALIEILEMVRDVGIQVLDLGEELIFAFLDIVIAVIKLFKVVLNAKIRLPFIAFLFEEIGAGELTILNVLGLLVAIPTTVIHKLMFGEAPFRDVLPPVLVSQPEDNPDSTSINSGNLLSLNSVASGQSDDEKERTKRKIRGFGGLALTADLINGLITTGLDARSEQSDDEGKATFILEIASIVLSWASWLGSFPASPLEPGGYPYALHKHKVSNEKNETESAQRLMWGWRTAILSLDTLYLVMAIKKRKPEEMPIQRLKRADEFSTFMVFSATLIDLELTGSYLGTLPQGKAKRLETANEIIAMLPNLLGFVRHSGPKGAAALAVLDGVTAVTNFGLGIKLLKDAVNAVDE